MSVKPEEELLVLGKHTDKELFEIVNKLNFSIIDFLQRFGRTPEEMKELKAQIEKNINDIQTLNEDLERNTEVDTTQNQKINELSRDLSGFVDIDSEQLIHGTKTFNRILVAHPSSDRDAVNLGYMFEKIASKFATIVGNLGGLKTENKNLIVSAINEIYSSLNDFKDSASLENRLKEIDDKLEPVLADIQTLKSTSSAANEKSDNAHVRLDTLEPKVEKNKQDIEQIRNDFQASVNWSPYENNPERKTIELKNNDTLTGKKTDDTRINIAHVSTRDIVELGSTRAPLNLSGNAERPTYNKNNSLAFFSDLDEKVNRIEMNDKANVSDVYNKRDTYNKNEIDSRLLEIDSGNFVTLQSKQQIPAEKTFLNLKIPNMPVEQTHGASAKYVMYYANALIKEKIGNLKELLTNKKTLIGAINELKNTDGDLSALKTEAKDNLSSAINEIFDTLKRDIPTAEEIGQAIDEKLNPVISNIGSKLGLRTNNKESLVNAINEISESVSDILSNKIGDISGLNTNDKTSLTNAINELKSEISNTSTSVIGDLSGLNTTNKDSVADAINELKSGLDNTLTESQTNQLLSDSIQPIQETLENVKNDYASKSKDNTLRGVNTFSKQIKVLEAPTEIDNVIRKVDFDSEITIIRNALANSLNFKGALNTVAELGTLSEKKSGDCYFIQENQVLYIYDGTQFINTGPIIDLSTLLDLSSNQNVTGTKKFTKLKANEPSESDDVVIKDFFDNKIGDLSNSNTESKENVISITNEIKSLITNMNFKGVKNNLEEIRSVESPKVGEIWLSNDNKRFYLFANEWMPFGIGTERIESDNLLKTDTIQQVTGLKTFEVAPKITGEIVNDDDAVNLEAVKKEVSKKIEQMFPSPPTWTELEFSILAYSNQEYGAGGFLSDVGIQLGDISGGLTEENKENVYWSILFALPPQGSQLQLLGGGVGVLVKWETAAQLLPDVFTTIANCRIFINSQANTFYVDWLASHPNYSDFSLDELKSFCKSKGLKDYLIITASKNNTYGGFGNSYSVYWAYQTFARIPGGNWASYGGASTSTLTKFKIYKVGEPGGVYDIHYSPNCWGYYSTYYDSSISLESLSYKMSDDKVVVVQGSSRAITGGSVQFRQLGTDENVFKVPLIEGGGASSGIVKTTSNQTILGSKSLDLKNDNSFLIKDSSLESPDILKVTKDKVVLSKPTEISQSGNFDTMSDDSIVTKANIVQSFKGLRIISEFEPPRKSRKHPIGTIWIKTSYRRDTENPMILHDKPGIYIKISETEWYAIHEEIIL